MKNVIIKMEVVGKNEKGEHLKYRIIVERENGRSEESGEVYLPGEIKITKEFLEGN